MIIEVVTPITIIQHIMIILTTQILGQTHQNIHITGLISQITIMIMKIYQ